MIIYYTFDNNNNKRLYILHDLSECRMRIDGWVLVTCHIRFFPNENQQWKLWENEEKKVWFSSLRQNVYICSDHLLATGTFIQILSKDLYAFSATICCGVIQKLLFALFNASTQAFKHKKEQQKIYSFVFLCK